MFGDLVCCGRSFYKRFLCAMIRNIHAYLSIGFAQGCGCRSLTAYTKTAELISFHSIHIYHVEICDISFVDCFADLINACRTSSLLLMREYVNCSATPYAILPR